MNIVKQIRNWCSTLGREPAKFSIQCDEVGLTQTVKREDGDEVIRLKWDQVANVFAYKRDLYSVDQICFVIECTDLGIEVREGDEGYESLIAQMQRNIPGFPAQDQWWEGVALPPFAPNWTKIYSREKGEVPQQT
jgi:hypothetical protein